MASVFRVVGVTFRNDDGTSRQEILKELYDDWWTEDREEEMSFSLVPEPENRFDPNAVAVVFTSDGRSDKVGYISKDECRDVGVCIQCGTMDGTAKIESMGLSKNANVALSISVEVYRDQDIQQDSTGRTYYYR